MGIGRSTFYDIPDVRAHDLTIVAEMKTICDEFEAYGYRRVDAELRHRGIVVNTKKIRRLMREHALNPKQHRRFIATTPSSLALCRIEGKRLSAAGFLLRRNRVTRSLQ